MINPKRKELPEKNLDSQNLAKDYVIFGLIVVSLLLIIGVISYVRHLSNPIFDEVSNQMAFDLCQKKGYESFMEVDMFKYQYYVINCWKIDEEKMFTEKFYFLRNNHTYPEMYVERAIEP